MQRILTKTKELFHNLLEQKKNEAPEEKKCSNALLLSNQDPNRYIECTPEKDMESFRHIVAGHVLVYAEIANSIPIADDGYSFGFPKEKYECCNHRSVGCNVFSEKTLKRMMRKLVGARICSYWRGRHSHSFKNDWGEFKRGEFVKSWLWKDEAEGVPVYDLCGLAWVEESFYSECYGNSDLACVSCMDGIVQDMTKRICCACGEPHECETFKKWLNNEVDWDEASWHSFYLMDGFEYFSFLHFTKKSDEYDFVPHIIKTKDDSIYEDMN